MKTTTTCLSLIVVAALISGLALAQSSSESTEEMQTLSYPASWNHPWMDGYLDPTNPQPPYMAPYTPLGSGPYKAIMATEPGAENLVAFYPSNLAALGDSTLPILVWGNGSCTYRGNKYRHLLTDVASYGYFVLGGGPMDSEARFETTQISSNNALRDPLAPRTPSGAQNNNRGQRVTVELLSEGIDWAIAENQRPESKFFNRLDTENIAVMGHSCGGGLASNFGTDSRVKTIGFWNSGGNSSLASGITKPTIIVPGDPRFDVAYYGAHNTYNVVRKTSAPVLFAWRVNLTHLGTFRVKDGGEESLVVRAWLDYQLKGDREAAKMFVGDDCGLCNMTGWYVESRNLR